MDKRYQVFVSSTYTDLKEERWKAMQALIQAPERFFVTIPANTMILVSAMRLVSAFVWKPRMWR
jgi:hypothetical protein